MALQTNKKNKNNLNDSTPPQWLQDLLKSQEETKRIAEENRRVQEERHQEQMEIIRNSLSSRTNENNSSNNETQDQYDKSTNVPRPPLLETDTNFSTFSYWRETWKDYYMLTRINRMSQDRQRAHFRSCLTIDMKSLLKCAIGVSQEDDYTVEEILDKIKNHLRNKRNVALDRVAFTERKQSEGESFDMFFVALKKLAEEADICEQCKDSRLTTQIMSGIKSQELKQKLLAITPFPNLHNVVDLCRSHESSVRDTADLQSKTINKIYSKNYNFQNDKCSYCGKQKQKPHDCPAFKSICKNCGKLGHWEIVCRSPKKTEINIPSNQANNSEQKISPPKSGFINHLKLNNVISEKMKTPKIIIEIRTTDHHKLQEIAAIPDTGAEVTVGGKFILQKLNISSDQLKTENENILMATNGTKINTIGSIDMIFILNNTSVTDKIIICEDQEDLLLSWHLCQKLKLVPEDFPKQIRSFSPMQINNNKFGKTSEEISKIRQELMEEFNDVFESTDELKSMKGDPMKIHLKKEHTPFALHTSRNIPFAWRDEVKETLDKMVYQKIIRKLEDEPTQWCHPVVIVPKPKSGLRLCVDLTRLNEHIERPVYPTKTPHEAVSNIKNGSKYFTTVDAKHGYWQLELEKSSQPLTTFITPWGRYMYLRAPMGLTSTGDEYTRRFDNALNNFSNFQKVMDDVILYDTTFEDHYNSVRTYLELCRKNSITLNEKKFIFAQMNVEFVGYKINGEGTAADTKKIQAIQDFATPINVTELKSFLGLANQLGHFTKELSSAINPLRDLLKTNIVFQWLPEHSKAFDTTKRILCSPPILCHFDPTKPTKLQTDASKNNGLGFVLLQCHNDQWKLVQCGSRLLTDTEKRYAIIELELLAVTWALKKCKIYLLGMNLFILNVDHRPLVSILDKKTLNEIENPRLQRLKEKTLLYSFNTEWVPGAKHVIADALSRSPHDIPNSDDKHEQDITENNIQLIRRATSSSNIDPLIQEISNVAEKDETYQVLINQIMNGFPNNKRSSPMEIKPYWNIRDHLSIDNGLVLFGCRIVIPKDARKKILQDLHSSHQGIERTKRRARQTVYWPAINSDIDNMVSSCSKCINQLPS